MMNKISIHNTFRSWLLGAVLGLASMNLFAHTDLESSVPAADAHLNEMPAELSLTFGAAVNLMEVAVVNGDGEKQPLDFKPSAQAAKTFVLSLPPLVPNTYIVHWIAMGKDGHKMSDNFSFMVHGELDTPMEEEHSTHHGH